MRGRPHRRHPRSGTRLRAVGLPGTAAARDRDWGQGQGQGQGQGL